MTLRRTAFYGLHKAMGARLADFHGWELPIQFTSILKEHQAVRTRCGVFDVSHMGQVLVEGPQALDFLQKVNANDIRLATPGKAVYSHLPNERGGIVDDVIVGCLAKGRYMVVVNAATVDKDFAWFQRHTDDFDVKLQNQSDQYSMLAVQGPAAAKVVPLLGADCSGLPKFGVMEARLFGQPCIIQRTGYTGEDGFEIMMPNEIASRFWEELMTRGQSFGMAACGLGARDTLRLESGLLLYGNDIDDDHTTLEAGYGWVVKFDKGDFIGKAALLEQKKKGLGRKLTGIKMLEAGVPRAGNDVYLDNRKLGTLCSATFSPTLQVGIGEGYFVPADLKPGQKVAVELHGRRAAAEVAAMPFYKRPQ